MTDMRWTRRIYEKDVKKMAAEVVCHLLINSPLESSNVDENYGVAAIMRYQLVWGQPSSSIHTQIRTPTHTHTQPWNPNVRCERSPRSITVSILDANHYFEANHGTAQRV